MSNTTPKITMKWYFDWLEKLIILEFKTDPGPGVVVRF